MKNSQKIEETLSRKKGMKPLEEQQRRIPLQDGHNNRCLDWPKLECPSINDMAHFNSIKSFVPLTQTILLDIRS